MTDTADLPPALTTEQAAELFGCTPDHLWRLVRENRAPVPVLRLGRMLRWPRQPILEALGLTTPDANDGPHQDPSTLTDPEVAARDQSAG